MESLESAATMRITELEVFDFGSKIQSHRTPTSATCWADERTS